MKRQERLPAEVVGFAESMLRFVRSKDSAGVEAFSAEVRVGRDSWSLSYDWTGDVVAVQKKPRPRLMPVHHVDGRRSDSDRHTRGRR